MQQELQVPPAEAFSFTGNALEYFRIWIVNLLLTILTLGIYSAWAKVRTNRYFYGNTIVNGSAFNYTADPIKILKGRLLAVAMLVFYQFAIRFYPDVAVGLLVLFVLFIPFIYVMSMAFRMRYTSWRGINFQFDRDYRAAYRIFAPVIIYILLLSLSPYLMGVNEELAAEPADDSTQMSQEFLNYFMLISAVGLIAMICFPLWQRFYYQYMGNRVNYGKTSFRIATSVWRFYRMYLIAVFMVIAGVFISYFFVLGSLQSGALNEGSGISTLILPLIPLLLPYLLAYAYIQTELTNIIYSNIELADIRFKSTLAFGRMAYLYITNTIAILCTLGMAIPWSKIRMARYRADNMMLMADDLDGFVAVASEDLDAGSDAVTDLFDLDIGL